MSERTPTTERIEDLYSLAVAWDAEHPDPGIRKMQANAREEFKRWLAVERAKWQAEAWDEGFNAGANVEHHTNWSDEYRAQVSTNPYREVRP